VAEHSTDLNLICTKFVAVQCQYSGYCSTFIISVTSALEILV